MSDDALRELLRSPLDDIPGRRVPRWAPWLLAGIAGGVLVGLGTLAVVDPGGPAEAGTTTVTTAATASSPAGLVVATETLAVEPIWATSHDGGLWVAITTPVAPGLRSGDAGPFPSAEWVLTTAAGRQIAATTQVVQPILPGLVTIEFPVGDDIDVAGATITVRPVAWVSDHQATIDLTAMGLPWSGPIDPVTVDDGAISVRSVDLADWGGTLQWEYEGPADTKVSVMATFSYAVAGDDGPRVIVPEHLLPLPPLQRDVSPQIPARAGELALFRLDDPEAPTFRSRWWGEDGPVEIESLGVSWQIRRYQLTGEEAVISLDGVFEVRDGF